MTAWPREKRQNCATSLKSSFYIDTLAKRKVDDTVFKVKYEYITAKVINNSTNQQLQLFNYRQRQ